MTPSQIKLVTIKKMALLLQKINAASNAPFGEFKLFIDKIEGVQSVLLLPRIILSTMLEQVLRI